MKLPVLASLVFSASLAGAVIPNVPDTFEDGSLMNWAGGDILTNITTTAKYGTHSLTMQAGNGGGNHLAAFNYQSRWTGDYAQKEILGISCWFKNMSNTNLVMRLVLFDTPLHRFSTNDSVSVPVGGPWVYHYFPITSTNVVSLTGGSYSALTHDVARVMFRHDPNGPTAGGAIVNGILAIDNPMTVTEPTASATLIGVFPIRRP